MRNSEQAEQKFRRATGIFWDREDPVTKYEWEYHHSVAEGLTASLDSEPDTKAGADTVEV